MVDLAANRNKNKTTTKKVNKRSDKKYLTGKLNYVVMDMDIGCVIHFENKSKANSRNFTNTTFEKFSSCREQWLSLDKDYKSFVSVAKKSLDRIPIETVDVTELNESNLSYHLGCYQLFTNKGKFERAKLWCQQQHRSNNGDDDSDNNDSQSSSTGVRRLSTRIATSQNADPINAPRTSESVLPRKCIVCKRAGFITVTDNKVKIYCDTM